MRPGFITSNQRQSSNGNSGNTWVILMKPILGCRRSAVNGRPRRGLHSHRSLLCWSSEKATRKSSIFGVESWQEECSSTRTMLRHTPLSRNVDTNLSNTHSIILIRLPLTTTSSRNSKMSSVVIILPEMIILWMLWTTFYTEEIRLLHNRWTKCVNVGRNYFENYFSKIDYLRPRTYQ